MWPASYYVVPKTDSELNIIQLLKTVFKVTGCTLFSQQNLHKYLLVYKNMCKPAAKEKNQTVQLCSTIEAAMLQGSYYYHRRYYYPNFFINSKTRSTDTSFTIMGCNLVSIKKILPTAAEQKGSSCEKIIFARDIDRHQIAAQCTVNHPSVEFCW